MVKKIDISCDVGESFGNYRLGNDEEIMQYLTSAHVACGFHAGDPLVMRRTVELAKKHGVGIGVHPGVPDLLGFGRRIMDITPEETKNYTIYQIGALKAFVEGAKLKLTHVKPHGVLFPMTSSSPARAKALVDGMLEADPQIRILYAPTPVVGPKASNLAKAGHEAGLKVVGEVYVDFEYNPDGTIIIDRVRKPVDALKAAQRIVKFVDEGKLKAIDGTPLEFEASSVCGCTDTPNGAEVFRTLRSELKKANIEVVNIREIVK